jgi:hypothetical protein
MCPHFAPDKTTPVLSLFEAFGGECVKTQQIFDEFKQNVQLFISVITTESCIKCEENSEYKHTGVKDISNTHYYTVYFSDINVYFFAHGNVFENGLPKFQITANMLLSFAQLASTNRKYACNLTFSNATFY